MDLFGDSPIQETASRKPLADRMRPRTMEDFVGQEHLLGPGKILNVLLDKKDVPSIVLWGPSGVGKTTIGWLIGKVMHLPFISLSAVSIGIKEVKEVIQKSKAQKIVLFVDEFHRFNKLQQDTFLPHVENGDIILIGATTENPSFEIISPLLSRLRVLTLEPLTKDHLAVILKRALAQDNELKDAGLQVSEETIDEMAVLANGDARRALNLLEISYKMVRQSGGRGGLIDHTIVREAFQRNIAVYDKTGEYHYDLISAFHKSIRGSDVDATLYWMARMIEGGEDPLYVARRMVRAASEDIGNANPFALTLSISAMQAFQFLGPPEGYLALAQAAVYLALSEKSNAIYKAYGAVSRDARNLPEYPVPMHIRNAPTKLMDELGYGKGYLYAHDFPGAMVKQEHLPPEMKGTHYYNPTNRGTERKLRDFMERVRRVQGRAGDEKTE
jgi:putative ATPase